MHALQAPEGLPGRTPDKEYALHMQLNSADLNDFRTIFVQCKLIWILDIKHLRTEGNDTSHIS